MYDIPSDIEVGQETEYMTFMEAGAIIRRTAIDRYEVFAYDGNSTGPDLFLGARATMGDAAKYYDGVVTNTIPIDVKPHQINLGK